MEPRLQMTARACVSSCPNTYRYSREDVNSLLLPSATHTAAPHQGVPYGNGDEDIEAAGGMGQLVAQGHGRDQGQRKQDKGGYGMR